MTTMILYQLAKWMEERTRLNRTIHEGGADIGRLKQRKELVEERMMEQATLWLEGSGRLTALELEEAEEAAEFPVAAAAYMHPEATEDLAVLSTR
ncbi:hypothetical protein [Paenibacillus cymbidii]|uniref:hypothetical protein n=1 Tax=Paenibacillus cymbidii TaxID=1639034 RepID=UPI001080C972|nr:hypothetical protein [Paenibacillus cymbidii]